jgi:hypothetical protein
MNIWNVYYTYDIILLTTNLAAAFKYNTIEWKYMCLCGRYTTYGDSYWSSIDNKLKYEPLQLSYHGQGPNQIYPILQILNAAPISKLCGHRKYFNCHA